MNSILIAVSGLRVVDFDRHPLEIPSQKVLQHALDPDKCRVVEWAGVRLGQDFAVDKSKADPSLTPLQGKSHEGRADMSEPDNDVQGAGQRRRAQHGRADRAVGCGVKQGSELQAPAFWKPRVQDPQLLNLPPDFNGSDIAICKARQQLLAQRRRHAPFPKNEHEVGRRHRQLGSVHRHGVK
jgi:hypothetical protein